MANDVLDISVHSTTKKGIGTIACNARFAADARHLALNFTSAGNIVNIPLGNEPLRVVVVNETDAITWEWRRGMAATKTVKVAPAATTPTSSELTIDTGSAITVTGDANNGNYSVNLSAALADTSKVLTILIDF